MFSQESVCPQGAGGGYLWSHVLSRGGVGWICPGGGCVCLGKVGMSRRWVRIILEYFLVYVNLYDHLSNMAIFGHFVYQLQRINKIGLTTDMFTKTIP